MNPDALSWAMAQATTSVWYQVAQAYAAGTLSVRFSDGRQVTYHSPTEMAKIISAGYAAAQTSTARRPAAVVARVGDGFA
jgi:hypothetical protein